MKKMWHVVILALIYSTPVLWLALNKNFNAHWAQNRDSVVECSDSRLASACTTNVVSRISISGGLFLTPSENFLD
jgi:hypothetical protein